jgi:hypothetical protein
MAVMCDEPSNPATCCKAIGKGDSVLASFKIAEIARSRGGSSERGAAGRSGGSHRERPWPAPFKTCDQCHRPASERADYANDGTADWGPTPGALSSGMTVSSLSVPLVAAGTELFDRLNQLDVTVSKVFSVRGTRFEPEMAVFNVLNGAAVSAVRSMNYGTASYEQPSTILQGRFVRLGLKMKW